MKNQENNIVKKYTFTNEDIIKITYKFCQINKRYAYLFDSFEDMKQDLLLKSFSVIDKYDCNYKLSCYIYKVLSNAIKMTIKKHYTKDKKIEFISIDNEYLNNKGEVCDIDYCEIMPDKTNIEEEFIQNNIIKNAKEYTKDYYIKGYNQREIGEKYKVSKQHISKLILRDLKELKNKYINS